MPSYDYKCAECGHVFTAFVAIKDKDRVKCTNCASSNIKQLFTGFNFFKTGSSACSSASGSNRFT